MRVVVRVRRSVAASLPLLFVASSLWGPAMPANGNQLPAASETIPFEVKAKDGVTLRGHVTLPGDAGPHATILELSPHFNTQLGGDTSQGPSSGAQEDYLKAVLAKTSSIGSESIPTPSRSQASNSFCERCVPNPISQPPRAGARRVSFGFCPTL